MESRLCFPCRGQPGGRSLGPRPTLRILSGDGPGSQGARKVSPKRPVRSQRKTLEGVADYLYRNHTRMRYDEYLANGSPVGSGPVEAAAAPSGPHGAFGMRWTEQMAEAIVQLGAKTRASTSPADLQHPVPVFRHALRPPALGHAAPIGARRADRPVQ